MTTSLPSVITSAFPTFLKITFKGVHPSSNSIISIPGLLADDVIVGFEGQYIAPNYGSLSFIIYGDGQLYQNTPYDQSNNTFTMLVARW
jgi:hypothetical protein